MIAVTDHALLRFVERASGQDVEAMRASIAERIARSALAAAAIGATNFNVQADGVFYLVRGSVIVTILPEDASVIARTRTLGSRGAA